MDARQRAGLCSHILQLFVRCRKGVAARIRTKTGIGSVKVYGDYDRINDEYVSPGFNSAENRVDLEVKGGVGSIAIQGQ
jgi:hypothetical protein